MPTLVVRDFSCIEQATLDLARLTVLIGPQASGKSVLSKLIYFFQDLLNSQINGVEIEQDFEAFKERATSEFKRWFPVSAWGSKKFHILFENGPLWVSIDRKKSYRKPSEGFHLVFSPYFHEVFEAAAASFRDGMAKLDQSPEQPSYMHWELKWQIRKDFHARFERELGEGFSRAQMFVPAGRAFFTSVGRAMAVFEKSGFLDPATLAFGRYWAAVRDSDHIGFEVSFPRTSAKLMTEIFGGELKVDRDFEYVLSPDGRKVPLSALSSGQQELLPLWMTLEQYFSEDERGGAESSMMYIEEPEAHLFPHAQSMLIEYLTSKLYVPAKNRRKMLITTHSPYVLAKLNNLLKASEVARRATKEQVAQISQLFPRASWLKRGHLSAYAIVDRRLISIIDDDGLVDALYLDSVSDQIMSQFSELLEIEYGK